jgi:maltooligosyltrehalose synthase
MYEVEVGICSLLPLPTERPYFQDCFIDQRKKNAQRRIREAKFETAWLGRERHFEKINDAYCRAIQREKNRRRAGSWKGSSRMPHGGEESFPF